MSKVKRAKDRAKDQDAKPKAGKAVKADPKPRAKKVKPKEEPAVQTAEVKPKEAVPLEQMGMPHFFQPRDAQMTDCVHCPVAREDHPSNMTELRQMEAEMRAKAGQPPFPSQSERQKFQQR